MLRLWRRLNQRSAELGNDRVCGDRVHVVEKDGRMWLATWQGLIAADAARRVENARSMRLVVSMIESHDAGGFSTRHLGSDEYVQGCCVGEFVWAVVDLHPRIVPGPRRRYV